MKKTLKYNNPGKSLFLIEIAKCWNNLDNSFMEKILADDLEYYTCCWIEAMLGRDSYLHYPAKAYIFTP